MKKQTLATVAGTVLGSLTEEAVEEIFPGLGELDWTGEFTGAISGLIGVELAEDEVDRCINSLLRHIYREINNHGMTGGINEDEAEKIIKDFEDLHESQQKRIIASFKNAAPHEFNYVQEMLGEIGG